MALTDISVRNAKPKDSPYKLFDERGLFLLVHPKGGKWWRLKYRIEGRAKSLSLGTYPDVSLQRARQRRDEARAQVADGTDPSATRKAQKQAYAITFAGIAEEWMKQRQRVVTPSTHTKLRWLVNEMLCPTLGPRPIATLKAADVLATLRRIEARGRHETAHRARQAASMVFRYAVATGRAEYDPTVPLRGALAPVQQTHRAAITDPAGVGALLRALHGYSGQPTVATALKLAPLLFVRPSELRCASWREFDLDGALWRIPAERMKMRIEHLVPLSRQTVALLSPLRTLTGPEGLLFPSLRTASRPISENTLNAALRRLGYGSDEMTTHGFRALASTLLNEKGYHPDIIELQLAHRERNQVRAAYNRAQRLADRTRMMQEWADYLDTLRSGAVILPLRRSA